MRSSAASPLAKSNSGCEVISISARSVSLFGLAELVKTPPTGVLAVVELVQHVTHDLGSAVTGGVVPVRLRLDNREILIRGSREGNSPHLTFGTSQVAARSVDQMLSKCREVVLSTDTFTRMASGGARGRSCSGSGNYPPEAYAPDGRPWWRVTVWPGLRRPFGAERRIEAWLAFNRSPGEMFTTSELRSVLGEDDVPNNQEHFQRRLRELRKDGWEIPSVKYDRNLEVGYYRLDAIGWHPGLGTERPKKASAVDAVTARRVLDRDGHRCVLCGIGSGEPHPRNSDRPAVITVGHVKPGFHAGKGDISNLRAECAICNEPLRADAAQPPTYEELLSAMRNLRTAELREIARWINAGHRIRTRADQFFDQLRMTSPGDRDRLVADLRRMVDPH